MKSLKAYVPESTDFDMGYIEPSKQGVRGKMRWIFENEEVNDMYAAYDTAKKTEVIIWCEGRKLGGSGTSRSTLKRPASDTDEGPQKKACRTTVAEKNSRKLEEVETVYTKLDEKHHGKMSSEQLKVWAHLVSMGKHESLEIPPDKPFFRGRKSFAKSNEKPSKVTPTTPDNSGSPTVEKPGCSPVRRSNLRSQYMQQLKEWHSLYEIGAISQHEFEEQKQTILEDLNKL